MYEVYSRDQLLGLCTAINIAVCTTLNKWRTPNETFQYARQYDNRSTTLPIPTMPRSTLRKNIQSIHFNIQSSLL